MGNPKINELLCVTNESCRKSLLCLKKLSNQTVTENFSQLKTWFSSRVNFLTMVVLDF